MHEVTKVSHVQRKSNTFSANPPIESFIKKGFFSLGIVNFFMQSNLSGIDSDQSNKDKSTMIVPAAEAALAVAYSPA